MTQQEILAKMNELAQYSDWAYENEDDEDEQSYWDDWTELNAENIRGTY